MALHRRRRTAPAPEHRRLSLAHHHRGRRHRGASTARPPALLRLGPDRGRLRRRHRAAGTRARLRHHDAEHVQPPVAERRGPDTDRRAGLARRFLWIECGLGGIDKPLSCGFLPIYTLKRNSTTSPSCMTYSLPSMRTQPRALASVMEPASTSWSKETI